MPTTLPILLVEDDPATRTVTRRILSAEGFTVIEAMDGVDALATLRTTAIPIRLVLSDVMMPGMDGIELCQNVRQLRDYRHTPIIMLTAMTFDLSARGELGGQQDQRFTRQGIPINAAPLGQGVRTAHHQGQRLHQ